MRSHTNSGCPRDDIHPTLAEVTLEIAIHTAWTSCVDCGQAGDIKGAIDAQAEMVSLILQRTPAQRVRMARDLGLARADEVSADAEAAGL